MKTKEVGKIFNSMSNFTRRCFIPVILCLLCFSHHVVLPAEEAPLSRAERWKQKRLEKLQNLHLYEPGTTENLMLRVEENTLLERFANGFWGFFPIFGGGVNVSEGTGVGLKYEPTRALEKFHFALRGGITTRGYQGLWGELGYTPDKLSLFGYSRYRKLPQEDFYGLGPNSVVENRTNYRLDDTIFGGGVGLRVIRQISASLQFSYLKNEFGEGTDQRFPQPGEVFPEGSLPGLGEDTEFLISSVKLTFDSRNVQPPPKLSVMRHLLEAPLEVRGSNPAKGTLISLHGIRYKDQMGGGRFDFSRLEFEFQQYLPFFYEHYAFVVRNFTSIIDRDDEGKGKVPFYMMRTLGGPQSLRGYEQFRFSDENLLLFNVEYRWAAWSGLDVALFFDAGDVQANQRDLKLDDMKTSYGFGFRFNTMRAVFARLEFAWSKEGNRIFLTFNNVF